ncbi:MAG: peptide chain release factor N(5)-glutamine methyltransferase [Bacilli bacterium]|jgi:release factor glutamine methyltransferase
MRYIDLINKYRKVESIEQEAIKFLIAEISGFSFSQLYLNLQSEIDDELLVRLEEAISKYVNNNIPVQYIVGYTYFLGNKIFVDNNVLIPRNETEEVVIEATKLFPKDSFISICDVGTGSGVIAICLKKHYTNSYVLGIDIEAKAIEVARANISNANIDVTLKKNDLLKGIEQKFDLIISNPPYIDPNEKVMGLVYDNEPHSALFSPNEGLYHYEEILKYSKTNLRKDGYIVFEVAYNKKQEMIRLVSKFYKEFTIMKDSHNNDRIMIIKGD